MMIQDASLSVAFKNPADE